MSQRKPLVIGPGGKQEIASGDTLPVSVLPVGTAAGTLAAGDDARITGAAPLATLVAAIPAISGLLAGSGTGGQAQAVTVAQIAAAISAWFDTLTEGRPSGSKQFYLNGEALARTP